MKYALVIGNSEYDDTSLAPLCSPVLDTQALSEVLRDPQIGEFTDVVSLVNQPEALIRREISSFLAGKKPTDLLLLYFSGHGLLDERGRLFLAARDTQKNLLTATAIPATFITDEMDRCRSRGQILVLDCCYGGAFTRGTKGEAQAVTKVTFEGTGSGRVVLTATDSTQFALDGEKVTGKAESSLFTHYLLEGLRTGNADIDQDGFISLDELYNYTYDQVVSRATSQTPCKWSYNQKGDLVIAKNPQPRAIPTKVFPQEIQPTVIPKTKLIKQIEGRKAIAIVLGILILAVVGILIGRFTGGIPSSQSLGTSTAVNQILPGVGSSTHTFEQTQFATLTSTQRLIVPSTFLPPSATNSSIIDITLTRDIRNVYTVGIGLNNNPSCSMVMDNGVLVPGTDCPEDLYKKLIIGINNDTRYLSIKSDQNNFTLSAIGSTIVDGHLVGCTATKQGKANCEFTIHESDGTVYTVQIPITGVNAIIISTPIPGRSSSVPGGGGVTPGSPPGPT